MKLKLGKKNYIICFKGHPNKELYKSLLLNGNDGYRVISKNGYVASCLKNGKIIPNGIGKTTFLVYGKNMKRITKYRLFVLPSLRRSYPILINRNNMVLSNYIPKDLICVKAGTKNWNIKKDIYICRNAYIAFTIMCEKANEEGIFFRVTHGFRDLKDQEELLNKQIAKIGKKRAESLGAPPGFSEHHTGLALDIGGMIDADGNRITTNNEVYKWIEENCYRYGFIIKNLKGKEKITGTVYEPWHIRYIDDLLISSILHENYLTLDEYLDYFIVK